MPDKILVVEDETALRETLAYRLAHEGYDVITAADGISAVEMARAQQPDVMVLDIMLPGMDGLDVCREVRKDMRLPILMLTARSDEIDKIIGLEVGADDYLTKPFNMRELLARVKALLRRVRLMREEFAAEQQDAIDDASRQASTLRFGNLVIDQARRVVLIDGEPLALKPKEYDLLVFLARHHRIALSRDKILEEVWGWDYGGGTRTVDVHIRWIREKIEDDPSDPKHIITVRGVGYRFEG